MQAPIATLNCFLHPRSLTKRFLMGEEHVLARTAALVAMYSMLVTAEKRKREIRY